MDLAESIEAPAPKALIGWLLLFERMGSKHFILQGQTYEEMTDLGFTRARILDALGILYPQVDAYNFWMFSESTRTAIPLLNDDSILTMYELYAKNDQAVTIIVRPVGHPSPNSCETPSAVESLLERRNLSGLDTLQGVPVEPRHPSPIFGMDTSYHPVSPIPYHDKLEIDLGGVLVAFPFLSVMSWVSSEIDRGVSPTDIKIITTEMPQGIPLTLTRSIWEKSLLNSRFKNDFVAIWSCSTDTILERVQYIQKLFDKYPDAKHNMHLLFHDLLSQDDVESRYRLSLVDPELLIGEPYFSATAAEEILQIPWDGETLKVAIQELPEKHRREPGDTLYYLLNGVFGWHAVDSESELNGNFDLMFDWE